MKKNTGRCGKCQTTDKELELGLCADCRKALDAWEKTRVIKAPLEEHRRARREHHAS